MRLTFLWSVIAGGAMLGLASTAAVGLPGQGLGTLEAGAPTSDVVPAHYGNHKDCRKTVPPPIASPGADRCHRHEYSDLVGWKVVPCRVRTCPTEKR